MQTCTGRNGQGDNVEVTTGKQAGADADGAPRNATQHSIDDLREKLVCCNQSMPPALRQTAAGAKAICMTASNYDMRGCGKDCDWPMYCVQAHIT